MGKRQIARAVTTALVIGGSLLAPTTAFAHKPIFADGSGASFSTATRIPDPEVSWAIYATLDEPSQVDYYEFEASQGSELFAQILIPKIESLHGHRPTLALVGPELPIPGDPLPTGLPPRTGALVVETPRGNGSSEFFEPFSQTSYWQRQEMRLDIPENGTYYLLVFDRQGDVGKYVLAVGSREEFGGGDWLQLPMTWWRIQWWFGRGVYMVVGAAALVGMVALITLVAAQRRRSNVSSR